jgi:hypothetical protein
MSVLQKHMKRTQFWVDHNLHRWFFFLSFVCCPPSQIVTSIEEGQISCIDCFEASTLIDNEKTFLQH